MPVLFLGHGSPMNALADNAYTQRLNALGRALPKPKAVLCISAHWETHGSLVTHMANPRTIHDFGGFPQALFNVQYPAPGDPALADRMTKLIPGLRLDEAWGLDHGTWSVLRHVYPAPDVPVLQLSMDRALSGAQHFQVGEKLRALRDEGVLIVGSGNIVHNLRKINWDTAAAPHAWTLEFDAWVKTQLERGDFASLCVDAWHTEAARFSVPTPEHYLPLLYVLGAADSTDQLSFIYEGFEHASLSMRCIQLG
ncbi:MAG: 4,5-DOPA dioxygenase extradiol [Rhodospirillaceae bacterium]|nr:4,5-DOPA dioxygenase extradiol [Rhodospirillaceae bacterium]